MTNPSLAPPTTRTSRATTRALVAAFSISTLAGWARPASADGIAAPAITILKAGEHDDERFIFVAPKAAGLAVPGQPALPQGPEIVDARGRPVWFLPIQDGSAAADFRVQRYRGEPVLTWSQGKGFGGVPLPGTTDYVLDGSYRVIATVQAGNGLNADPHEFRLTPEGTALITIYHAVSRDLSSAGGSPTGQVVDGIVQEIDVATGRVLLEWHSLDHVGIDESYQPLPASASAPYDYFHLNAVSVDEDGDLLLSARHTWAVYKIQRHTGAIVWRLGGKRSDFALGAGVQFSYQHDPIAAGRDVIRIFDNASSGAPGQGPSRVIWVRLDRSARTATLVREIVHPDALTAPSQGNAQGLDEGDTFVGWGQVGRFSQFDRDGRLVLDGSVPVGQDTYRAYRFEWRGHPATPPTAAARDNADGTTTVHASWNGATEVERWEILGGASPEALRLVDQAEWNGLDTAVTLNRPLRYVQVRARDRRGRFLGVSDVVAVAH